jgi:hypothetical protein
MRINPFGAVCLPLDSAEAIACFGDADDFCGAYRQICFARGFAEPHIVRNWTRRFDVIASESSAALFW